MKECPKCKATVQSESSECPVCGVVFEKWRQKPPPPPKPGRPSPQQRQTATSPRPRGPAVSAAVLAIFVLVFLALSLPVVIPVMILVSALWVFQDADRIRREKGLANGPEHESPLAWAAAVLFLWIVAFPYYLVKRDVALQRAPGDPPDTRKPGRLILAFLATLVALAVLWALFVMVIT